MTEDCIAAKSYKSTHMYAVEDYGFSSEEIERYMYGHVTKYEVFGIPQVKPLN